MRNAGAIRSSKRTLLQQTIREFLSEVPGVEAVLVVPEGRVTHVWSVIRVPDQRVENAIYTREARVIEQLRDPLLDFHATWHGVMPLGRFLRSFMRTNGAVCIYRRRGTARRAG